MTSFLIKSVFVIFIGIAMPLILASQVDDPRQKHFNQVVQPIMRKHCFSCHNEEDQKGGIAISDHYFISAIVRRGELYQKVIEQIETGMMPPDIKPPMTQAEIDTVTHYINSYLQSALAEKDPGIIAPRRLNNQEYKYVIKDLLGLEIDVDSIFPSDPSGGAGFDNHAGVLYLTPLLVERYFETADFLLDTLYTDKSAWRKIVPVYKETMFSKFRTFWYRTFYNKDISLERPLKKASEILLPFSSLAYRSFLSSSEEARLLELFTEAYLLFESEPDRFDRSIRETLKRILVSHHFLFRLGKRSIEKRSLSNQQF